ncbi:MAG: type VII toxin-antitoxin system MntA family adenylyltransferase antitoxin [Candidatus Binatia bacterium]
MNQGQKLEGVLTQAEQDAELLAVLLFGSAARQQETPTSDLDVCLVLLPQKYDNLALSRKRLEYMKHFDLDVHIFQQLPLYIRQRVVKEGRVLFCRDEELLYSLAFQTVQAFERFKPIYLEYLAEVARAGS